MKEIKNRIKKSGLKQKFIAEIAGISESHLTMMLNGNANMSNSVKLKINEVLDKYLSN